MASPGLGARRKGKDAERALRKEAEARGFLVVTTQEAGGRSLYQGWDLVATRPGLRLLIQVKARATIKWVKEIVSACREEGFIHAWRLSSSYYEPVIAMPESEFWRLLDGLASDSGQAERTTSTGAKEASKI